MLSCCVCSVCEWVTSGCMCVSVCLRVSLSPCVSLIALRLCLLSAWVLVCVLDMCLLAGVCVRLYVFVFVCLYGSLFLWVPLYIFLPLCVYAGLFIYILKDLLKYEK